MRIGPGNDGPEPAGHILRAIRHAVSAGACRVAAASRGGPWRQGCAALHRSLGEQALQVEARSRVMTRRRRSARSASDSTVISESPLAEAARTMAANQDDGIESIRAHSRAFFSGQPTASENAEKDTHREMTGRKKC